MNILKNKRIKAILKKFFVILKPYIIIIAGSIAAAAGINMFLVPFKIAPGGVTGLATVIYYISNKKLPVGTVMFLINVPLFIIGLKTIGQKFIIRTLFGTLFLSVFIDITASFMIPAANKFLTDITGKANDMLLFAVFGGALMGTGIGIVLRTEATTGGTDLAARIFKKHMHSLSVGELILIIDGIVVAIAAITFNSIQIGLYSITSIIISSKVIDSIQEGLNFAKLIYIISDKWDEIANKILTDAERGVTAINGRGMYTGNEKNVLLCVTRARKIHFIKKIVKNIDKDAFVIVSDAKEVLGEGFGQK